LTRREDRRGGDVEGRPSLRRRLTWFGGLWAAGVLVVAAVAYGIRFWLGL